MVTFECENCQAKFKLPDELAGRTGQCPKCGATIHVPAAEPVAADKAPQAAAGPEEYALASDDTGETPLADEPAARAAPAAKAVATRPKMPPPSPSGLVVMPIEDIMVVNFQTNSILDATVIETIGKELFALVDQQARRKILLDFQKVQFLSSQMLGVLITLQKKSAAIKGKVVLCAVRPELRKVFTIMKLEKLLPIAADETKAMDLLGFRGGA